MFKVLIKPEYALLLSDDEIKPNEWLYDEEPETGLDEIRRLISTTSYQGGGHWKILASTTPDAKDNGILLLSQRNIDRCLQKKEYWRLTAILDDAFPNNDFHSKSVDSEIDIFMFGYNVATEELTKDKYSISDILKCLETYYTDNAPNSHIKQNIVEDLLRLNKKTFLLDCEIDMNYTCDEDTVRKSSLGITTISNQREIPALTTDGYITITRIL